MQDLKDLLRKGKSLDELWKVARGEIKYADFMAQRGGKPGPKAVTVPEELVGS